MSMASLPPRPESQRRVSPRDSQASSQHEQRDPATPGEAPAVLLNRVRSPLQSPLHAQATGATEPAAAAAPKYTEVTEPRKCWICFNDETEDDERTSEWRSPCPCVLVAHEKCLLDWIADMEAPSARRRAGGRQGKILCPQCRSEIRLQRPRSAVVDAVRLVERLTGTLLLPGVLALAGTAVVTTLSLIGRTQVYHIFGLEDGLQILAPLYQAPDLRETSTVTRAFHHFQQHWRLHVGLPLIPTVLMASRSSVADSFLPFIPLVFFVKSASQQDDMLRFSWPPSAAFIVAALPYLRRVYNAYYETVWAPREQRWLKEIQPRANTDSEPANADVQLGEEPHLAEEEFVEHGHGEVEEEALEVEVDFDIFADWNNGGRADNNNALENPPVPIARGPAPPLNEPPDDEILPFDAVHDEAAPAPNVPPQPRPVRLNRGRRERNIFSTTSLADTILGALVFPTVAAAVGEALKFALPKSWVTPPVIGRSTGFLQSRWGRSMLGGCLFVGVKDAVMLYVRWKVAQNHRKRGVLNYNKGRKNSQRA